MACPEENILLDFVQGELAGTASDELEAHVDQCETCAIVLSELAKLQEPNVEFAVTDDHLLLEPGQGTPSLRSGSQRLKIAPSLSAGDHVGRYVILEKVGAGGMGVVYAAYDPELDRKVAIKLLMMSLGGSLPKELKDLRARLMREAQAMAKLSHPNVITVHDVGEFREQIFVAMEFIDGTTLTQWCHDTHRPWREVLPTYLAAGRGLAAAHDAGLVHRDFKPDNVLLGRDGRVVVTDFGLARPAAGRTGGFSDLTQIDSSPVLSAHLTQTGALVGTPAFMSPEQLAGDRCDALSDQFSYCVALYDALYGERPFEGKVLSQLIANVSMGRVRAPPRDASVPRWLRRALVQGLEVSAGKRYHEMDSLLIRLGRNPAALWRKRAVVVLPPIVLVAGFAAYETTAANHGSHYCKDVVGHLEGVWDKASQTEIEHAFQATKVPFAQTTWEKTRQHLDEHAAQWLEVQTSVCEAESKGTQPQALLALSMSCLEQRLGGFAALSTILKRADASTIEYAIRATDSLEDPASCTNTERMAFHASSLKDVASRKVRSELAVTIAKCKALRSAGRYQEAREQCAVVARLAADSQDRWMEAEALTVLADATDLQGNTKEAIDFYHQAMSAALASNNSEVVVKVAIGLLWSQVPERHPIDDARRWYQHGKAAGERANAGPELLAQLETAMGTVYSARGWVEAAQRSFGAAIDIRTKAFGPDHESLGSVTASLARLYVQTGRIEQARDAFERAQQLAARELGPQHPNMSGYYSNLATTYGDLREFELAERFARRALELDGNDTPRAAASLTNLAAVLVHQGRVEEAKTHAIAALRIEQDQLPAGSAEIAHSHAALARIEQYLGNPAAALEHARTALHVARLAKLGPWREMAYHLTYARHLLDAGRADEALELVKPAVPMLSGDTDVAPAQRLLVLALWAHANATSTRPNPAVAVVAQRQAAAVLAVGCGDQVLGCGEATLALAKAQWSLGQTEKTRDTLATLASQLSALGKDGQALHGFLARWHPPEAQPTNEP